MSAGTIQVCASPFKPLILSRCAIKRDPLTRREVLRRGAVLTAGSIATALVVAEQAEACSTCQPALVNSPPPSPYVEVGKKLHPETVVNLDSSKAPAAVFPEPLDPMKFLTHFDYGKVTKLPNGVTQRDYVMVATDRDIEVATGTFFPAWTFNGGVPGPTLRCTEGDLLRIHFYNRTPRDHTIHFHGIHAANMDGALEIVPSGGYYLYEFTAEPFGCMLYHCHMAPLRKHISKGMYGAFIIDPPEGRPPALEMTMVMQGYDTEMTLQANSFYAVNGPAFYYRDYPIEIPQNQLVRIYLVNLTEIDLINSLHLHGNMFKLFRTGTQLDRFEITDTVMLCQGERSVLEFSYKFKGDFLFHSHQNEFAERGWLGILRVV